MRNGVRLTDSVLWISGAGLQYLRRMGIVHRDLKPGNILRSFTEDGRYRQLAINKVDSDDVLVQHSFVVVKFIKTGNKQS